MTNTLIAASLFVVGTLLFLGGAVLNWLIASGRIAP